ncbi:MAG: preprotein translocase subunit YajC [Rhodocyclaceae bacterium]
MFISNAYAQTAAAADAPAGGLLSLLPMVLIFVVMYFIMIRPQMKRAKEHKNLLAALAKGDEVITAGGIAGRITQVQDNFVKVAISDGVEVTVQKGSIGTVLPKGTLKNA